jgi:hypothetical protein
MVRDTDWTKTPKAKRATYFCSVFPEYAAWASEGRDSGLDASDALGLAIFTLRKSTASDLIARAAKGGRS